MAAVTWISDVSGNASVTTNWDAGRVPTGTDVMTFGTHVGNCSLDVACDCAGFNMTADYSGTVSQTVTGQVFRASGFTMMASTTGTFTCLYSSAGQLFCGYPAAGAEGGFHLLGGTFNLNTMGQLGYGLFCFGNFEIATAATFNHQSGWICWQTNVSTGYTFDSGGKAMYHLYAYLGAAVTCTFINHALDLQYLKVYNPAGVYDFGAFNHTIEYDVTSDAASDSGVHGSGSWTIGRSLLDSGSTGCHCGIYGLTITMTGAHANAYLNIRTSMNQSYAYVINTLNITGPVLATPGTSMAVVCNNLHVSNSATFSIDYIDNARVAWVECLQSCTIDTGSTIGAGPNAKGWLFLTNAAMENIATTGTIGAQVFFHAMQALPGGTTYTRSPISRTYGGFVYFFQNVFTTSDFTFTPSSGTLTADHICWETIHGGTKNVILDLSVNNPNLASLGNIGFGGLLDPGNDDVHQLTVKMGSGTMSSNSSSARAINFTGLGCPVNVYGDTATIQFLGTGAVTFTGPATSWADDGPSFSFGPETTTFTYTAIATKMKNVTSTASHAVPSVIRSSSAGHQYGWIMSGTSSLADKVDVQDCDASGGLKISAIGSVGAAQNNLNWSFSAGSWALLAAKNQMAYPNNF